MDAERNSIDEYNEQVGKLIRCVSNAIAAREHEIGTRRRKMRNQRSLVRKSIDKKLSLSMSVLLNLMVKCNSDRCLLMIWRSHIENSPHFFFH